MVANEISSKIIPCIYWFEQRVKEGTGPARIEILETLRRRGYEYIIWGDSENIYSEKYVERILTMLERGCDVTSGRSIVTRRSIWSEAFYWYHSLHSLFPRIVGSRHAPGNNMGIKIWVYDIASYPPSKRSDDNIFTLSLIMKRSRSRRPKYCIEEDAVVYVSTPKSFKEIIAWQRSRVSGLVRGSLYIGLKIPLDLLIWGAPLALTLALLALSISQLNLAPLVVPLTIISILSIFLHIKSYRYLDKGSLITGVVAALGMILHAIFTIVYALKDLMRIYIRDGVSNTIRIMREIEIAARNNRGECVLLPLSKNSTACGSGPPIYGKATHDPRSYV